MKEDLQDLAENFINEPTDENFTELFKFLSPKLKKIFMYKMFFEQSLINTVSDELKTCSVDDIIQETFLKLLLNYQKYDGRAKFSTWMYTIAKNEFLIWKKKTIKNHHLKRKVLCQSDRIHRSYSNLEEKIEKISIDSLAPQQIVAQYTVENPLTKLIFVEDECCKTKLLSLVYEEIYSLPKKYKDIVYDREIEGLPYETLACKYNVPMQTIKNRIRLGRKKISDKLGQEYVSLQAL